MYPVTLQGTHVRLRDFVPDDLDATMAIVGDPAVTRWLSFDTRTRADQARRLADDVARAQADPRPDYYLAVEVAETAELVGFARLGPGNGHRCGEVGYAIRHDHQRRGYAGEATGLLLGLAFSDLGLHRVTAATGPDNTASRAVLERLGFTFEGRIASTSSRTAPGATRCCSRSSSTSGRDGDPLARRAARTRNRKVACRP